MSVVCVGLFCKQKTAYEVRSSDWSSDVCCSDLATESNLFIRSGVSRGVCPRLRETQQLLNSARKGRFVLVDLVAIHRGGSDRYRFPCSRSFRGGHQGFARHYIAACERRSFIGWMLDDGWIHANDVGAVVYHHKLSVLSLPLEQGPRFAIGRQTLWMHDQRQVLSHCHTDRKSVV